MKDETLSMPAKRNEILRNDMWMLPQEFPECAPLSLFITGAVAIPIVEENDHRPIQDAAYKTKHRDR